MDGLLSVLLLGWPFWWRGRVRGPRVESQVTEPSISIAEQEGREAAVFSWKLSSWGTWEDSGLKAGLDFNGRFMEAK